MAALAGDALEHVIERKPSKDIKACEVGAFLLPAYTLPVAGERTFHKKDKTHTYMWDIGGVCGLNNNNMCFLLLLFLGRAYSKWDVFF